MKPMEAAPTHRPFCRPGIQGHPIPEPVNEAACTFLLDKETALWGSLLVSPPWSTWKQALVPLVEAPELS